MAAIIGIGRHRIGVDGKGVTTLVALHGCPLNCKYCLNPQCHQDDVRTKLFSPAQLHDVVKKDHRVPREWRRHYLWRGRAVAAPQFHSSIQGTLR